MDQLGGCGSHLARDNGSLVEQMETDSGCILKTECKELLMDWMWGMRERERSRMIL